MTRRTEKLDPVGWQGFQTDVQAVVSRKRDRSDDPALQPLVRSRKRIRTTGPGPRGPAPMFTPPAPREPDAPSGSSADSLSTDKRDEIAASVVKAMTAPGLGWDRFVEDARSARRRGLSGAFVYPRHVLNAQFARAASIAASAANVLVAPDTLGHILEAARRQLKDHLKVLPADYWQDVGSLAHWVDPASVRRAWSLLNAAFERAPFLRDVPADRRWEFVIDRQVIDWVVETMQLSPSPTMLMIFDGISDDEPNFAELAARGWDHMTSRLVPDPDRLNPTVLSIRAQYDGMYGVPSALHTTPVTRAFVCSANAQAACGRFIDAMRPRGIACALQEDPDFDLADLPDGLTPVRFTRGTASEALLLTIMGEFVEALDRRAPALADPNELHHAWGQFHGDMRMLHIYPNGMTRLLEHLRAEFEIRHGLPVARLSTLKWEASDADEKAVIMAEGERHSTATYGIEPLVSQPDGGAPSA